MENLDSRGFIALNNAMERAIKETGDENKKNVLMALAVGAINNLLEENRLLFSTLEGAVDEQAGEDG